MSEAAMKKPNWLTDEVIDKIVRDIEIFGPSLYFICTRAVHKRIKEIPLGDGLIWQPLLEAAGICADGPFRLVEDAHVDGWHCYEVNSPNKRRIAWLRSLKLSNEIQPAAKLAAFEKQKPIRAGKI